MSRTKKYSDDYKRRAVELVEDDLIRLTSNFLFGFSKNIDNQFSKEAILKVHFFSIPLVLMYFKIINNLELVNKQILIIFILVVK